LFRGRVHATRYNPPDKQSGAGRRHQLTSWKSVDATGVAELSVPDAQVVLVVVAERRGAPLRAQAPILLLGSWPAVTGLTRRERPLIGGQSAARRRPIARAATLHSVTDLRPRAPIKATKILGNKRRTRMLGTSPSFSDVDGDDLSQFAG
jgi:hypothetical protein